MKEFEVKKEFEDIDDIDDCIPELTKLLEEVKREEVAETETESQPGDVDRILKSFADGQSSDSADDADIQQLQELLREKQKELKESEEQLERNSRRSSSPDRSNSRKKKRHEHKRKFENSNESRHNEKRKKENTSRNKAPTNDDGISENQNPDISSTITMSQKEEPTISAKTERLPTEEELENLLQPSDHSDEEPCGSNQIMDTVGTAQQVSCSTSPIPFDYEAIPPTEFDNFYNAVPSFNAVHTEHFPVREEEDELQCLPVINSAGFSGMPMFKRIKLERPGSDHNEESASAIEETPRDRRKKIFETCMSLLERLEFSEPSGKFIFTPTITRADSSEVCNSILQRIPNVHYDFQSIGPKLNLSDWGLKAIGNANGPIAKAVGISADAYFSKIKQKSDTMTGKLIKVETDRREKNNFVEIEVEEPNLSTFFKNSVTQTEPLVCQKCVARNRIVGHDVGVQAKVYASSIGTQTYSNGNDHSEVTAGLSDIQLRALYEFSHLVRESTIHPSIEMFQTRSMEIYKIIQNESKHLSPAYHAHSRGLVDERRTVPSNVPAYPPQIPQPGHMQRSYSHERSRPVPSVGLSHAAHMIPVHIPPSHRPPSHMQPAPVQSFHSSNHTMHHPSSRDPRQASMNPSPAQAYWHPSPGEQFPSYHIHGMPGPLHHSPNGSFPSHQGPPPTNYGYPPATKENRISYGRGHRL